MTLQKSQRGDGQLAAHQSTIEDILFPCPCYMRSWYPWLQQQKGRWVAGTQPVPGSALAAGCQEAAHPSAEINLSTQCWHCVQVGRCCLGGSHIRVGGILRRASLSRHCSLSPAAGRGRQTGEELGGQPRPLGKHPS